MNVLQRKMERQNDKTKHYVKRTNRGKNTQWTAAATASKRRVRERESEREWQKIVCNYLTNNLLLIQYNWPLLEHHFHFNGRCRRWYYILRCDAVHTHIVRTQTIFLLFLFSSFVRKLHTRHKSFRHSPFAETTHTRKCMRLWLWQYHTHRLIRINKWMKWTWNATLEKCLLLVFICFCRFVWTPSTVHEAPIFQFLFYERVSLSHNWSLSSRCWGMDVEEKEVVV